MRWLAVVILISLPVRAGDAEKVAAVIDPQLRASIVRAIQRGVANLKATQARSGAWNWSSPLHQPGVTALALYALSASKVASSDETIVRGTRWTERNASTYGSRGRYATYSASALVLALARSDADRHAARVRGIAQRIVDGQSSRGIWGYSLGRARGGDNSNTQFAVMALWMAETHCDFKVPERTWKRVARLFGASQNTDGGWDYGNAAASSTDSMTAAGLFGFVVSNTSLKGGLSALPEVRESRAAQRGLRRLLAASSKNNLYFLYGLERAATLMGAPPEQWYVDRARELVKIQQADGGWGRNDPYSTSLALLFLSRATRYVVTPRKAAKTVTTARFPDVVTPANLKRAFEAYVLAPSDRRAQVRPRFAGAGAASIGLFVERLGDPEPVVRVAAHELLVALLAHPLLFDPQAPREDRRMMVHAIRNFYGVNRSRLTWDADSSRFVRR